MAGSDIDGAPRSSHCAMSLSTSMYVCMCRYLYLTLLSQQTRGVGPMLVCGWASVVDDGPTSAQHWANASCLLGSLSIISISISLSRCLCDPRPCCVSLCLSAGICIFIYTLLGLPYHYLQHLGFP